MRHHPIHYLFIQLIPCLPKPGHDRRDFGIAHRLANFKASACHDPLIAPTYQACIQANHHLQRITPVFTLERLQLPAQLIVGLQIGVVGTQQRHPAIALEAIHEAVAQQHRRRIAPARAGVAADQVAIGHHGDTRAVEKLTGLGFVDAQRPGHWRGSAGRLGGRQAVYVRGLCFGEDRAGADQRRQRHRGNQSVSTLHGVNSLFLSLPSR